MLTCGVIIPLSTRIEFLHEAIESVYNQTCALRVVIVVGNVPIPEDCKTFFVHDNFFYIQTSLDSFIYKVNTAARMLDTDAMYVLCDDDKLHPKFTETVLSAMETHGVDIVYTDMEMFGLDPRVVEAAEWTADNFYLSTVPFMTSLISVDAFMAVNGYTNCPFTDWDLWWRCFDAGMTAFHFHAPLFLYRTSEQQGSRSPEQAPNMELYRNIVRSRHSIRMIP